MKKRILNFCQRGLICSGFGPVTYGIVMLILYLINVDTTIDGLLMFKGIVSTYILAFIVAGASIIWQEEKIGLAFQILIHGLALYISYLLTYLINGWIKSNINDFLMFSVLFICSYAIIWLIILCIEKAKAKKLNKQLK